MFTDVKSLISDDRLEEAISILQKEIRDPAAANELIQYSARIAELNKHIRTDTLSYDEISRTKNKIRGSLLNIIKEIENRDHNRRKETKWGPPKSIIRPIHVILPLSIGLIIWFWGFQGGTTISTNGSWIVKDIIESSSHRPYIGDSIIFKIVLSQSLDGTIEGRGEKIAVNQEKLVFDKRTSIQLKGFLKNDSLHLIIFENGVERNSTGEFNLKHHSNNRMAGTFRSSAGRTEGRAYWIRE